jgi:predicted acylesterase/phospholipase RssA
MGLEIEYLVLQGGGLRCAWQAGFIAALERERPMRPVAIAAVSASSTVACALVCGRLEFAVECFKSAILNRTKGTFAGRVMRGRRMFPHAEIYRDAVLRTFDQAAMESLLAGPDIQILVTRTSLKLPKYAGALAGLALYGAQGFGTRRGYRRLEEFGFCKEFVAAKRCATPGALADLILASSCTPPFTPFYSLFGRPVLDGGLSENVPLSGLPERRGTTLVLLTERGVTVDRVPGVVYSEPSEAVHANSWDYDVGKIDYLYALGRKDGSAFVDGWPTDGHEVCLGASA